MLSLRRQILCVCVFCDDFLLVLQLLHLQYVQIVHCSCRMHIQVLMSISHSFFLAVVYYLFLSMVGVSCSSR
jgi:hypothetical protein